jgi:hypothetical protein
MDIRMFNDIFVNKVINNKIMIVVELFLFLCLLFVIIRFNNFYDYYNGKGEIKNKNILSTLVITDEIEVIKSNKNMMIGNKKYAYIINGIDEESYISNGFVYKVVNIKISNYKELDNNYVNYQIIKKKDTILNYFIKTMRGG